MFEINDSGSEYIDYNTLHKMTTWEQEKDIKLVSEVADYKNETN